MGKAGLDRAEGTTVALEEVSPETVRSLNKRYPKMVITCNLLSEVVQRIWKRGQGTTSSRVEGRAPEVTKHGKEPPGASRFSRGHLGPPRYPVIVPPALSCFTDEAMSPEPSRLDCGSNVSHHHGEEGACVKPWTGSLTAPPGWCASGRLFRGLRFLLCTMGG